MAIGYCLSSVDRLPAPIGQEGRGWLPPSLYAVARLSEPLY